MRPATFTVIVDKIHVEAMDTVSIELRASDSAPLPAFDAGSHISLHLPNGIVQTYSLVNATGNRDRYILGVLRARDSQGGSAFAHEKLRTGDSILISEPCNNFPLDEIRRAIRSDWGRYRHHRDLQHGATARCARQPSPRSICRA